jgi:hypothetical protein
MILDLFRTGMVRSGSALADLVFPAHRSDSGIAQYALFSHIPSHSRASTQDYQNQSRELLHSSTRLDVNRVSHRCVVTAFGLAM